MDMVPQSKQYYDTRSMTTYCRRSCLSATRAVLIILLSYSDRGCRLGSCQDRQSALRLMLDISTPASSGTERKGDASIVGR